jgi:hypothetical protein
VRRRRETQAAICVFFEFCAAVLAAVVTADTLEALPKLELVGTTIRECVTHDQWWVVHGSTPGGQLCLHEIDAMREETLRLVLEKKRTSGRFQIPHTHTRSD